MSFAETGRSGFGTSLAFCFYGELGLAVWSQTSISRPCSVSDKARVMWNRFDLRNRQVAAITSDSVSMVDSVVVLEGIQYSVPQKSQARI
jgi:hypothetical protein